MNPQSPDSLCRHPRVKALKHHRVCPQVHGFEGLSGSQRLAILDALVHAAADSEGLRASVLEIARKQVA